MLSKLLGGAIKYALSLSDVLDRKFAHRHAELLQSCPTVARQAPLSVISRQEYQSRVLCPPPGDLFDPGIELTSPVTPALKADSLPLSHQGSPRILKLGSLSPLQGIFLTQELNQGLPYFRWILYQLSYQGSPFYIHT